MSSILGVSILFNLLKFKLNKLCVYKVLVPAYLHHISKPKDKDPIQEVLPEHVSLEQATDWSMSHPGSHGSPSHMADGVCACDTVDWEGYCRGISVARYPVDRME